MNKAQVEGSISIGYIMDEAAKFVSFYFKEALQKNSKIVTTNCDHKKWSQFSDHKKWSQFSDHITTTVQSQSSNLICDYIVTTISDHIACGH